MTNILPKISVIMGVYTGKEKKLVSNSIYSIINQTYSDWEMIICADGSPQETVRFLEEFHMADNRIRIVSYEHNRGLAYALNYALQYTSGEYIATQDDDDESYPERLQKELDFLEKNINYAMVGTCVDIYDDTGNWGECYVDEVPQKNSFLWNSPFVHPTMLFRRNALEQVNGYRVAKETRRCEDYDMFMRMYAQGLKGYNIQEKLYRYRIINTKDIKYRPMKVRLEEARVRFYGYKKMGILLQGVPYIIKPLILGLIPQKIFYYIRKSRY